VSRARRRLVAFLTASLALTLAGGASAYADNPTPTATGTSTSTATGSQSTTAPRPSNSSTRQSGGSGSGQGSTQPGPPKVPDEDLVAGISLTSLAPAVMTPADTLVIKGTVTNTGETPIQNGVIRLLVHHSPLSTRTLVAQWSNGAIDDVGGRILDASTDLTITLRPGASTRFTIKAPADRLGLFMDFASIGITLETLGDDGSDIGTHRVGLLRTYISWQRSAAYTPLRLSWLLPVTGGPNSATGGPPDSATLAAAIADHSRLKDVLTAVSVAPKGAGVSVAVDPALVSDLRVRSKPGAGSAGSTDSPSPSGPPTSSASTTSTPTAPTITSAEQSVAAYLSALKTAVADRRLVQLPYGDPDLMGLADARGQNLLAAADAASVTADTSILAGELGATSVITDVAWPSGGWADAATIAAVPRVGARTLVLAASSRPPTLEQSSTPTGVAPVSSTVNAVLFDDVLSNLLSRTNSTPNAVLNIQRFLAETLATVYESPQRSRTLLVAAPRTFDPDPLVVQRFFAAVGAARWIKPATLTQLRNAQGQATVTDRVTLPVPASVKRAQMPTSQVTAVRDARADAAQLASVVSGDDQLARTRVDALRLLSTSYRGRIGTAALQVRALKAALAAEAAKVRILPLSNLNFLASDGNLTFSVANGLSQQVKGIRVVVEPGNGRLVVVKQAPSITVEAERRTTIKVHVHAVAGGIVPVTARILTPGGLQMGKTVTVRVHVRPTDTWAFWVIGVAAGLTFLIGLVRTLRRGRARPRLVAPEVDEL
jgi:hypothetical protein